MTPRRSPLGRAFALLAMLLAATSPAAADVLTIDFNGNSSGNNAAVNSYMQGVVSGWHPGGTVTVSGAVFQRTYTGDNHVVGPPSGNTFQPITLGTSDGGALHSLTNDSFITNSNNSDRITMTFGNGLKIYSVSFDYQIFPDGTLPDGTDPNLNPDNWPDFKFKADGVQYIYQLGIMPGQDGTFLHSPDSGPNHPELAPQFIGQSGVFYFPNGVSVLEFIDWPRTIGIDNLTLSNAPTPTPEPSSLFVWSLLLVGLCAIGRRFTRQPAPAMG